MGGNSLVGILCSGPVEVPVGVPREAVYQLVHSMKAEMPFKTTVSKAR